MFYYIATDDNLQRAILARLVRLEQKVDKVLNQQELQLQNMGLSAAAFEAMPADIQLPVKSDTKLTTLNTLLLNDNSKKLLVVSSIRITNIKCTIQ